MLTMFFIFLFFIILLFFLNYKYIFGYYNTINFSGSVKSDFNVCFIDNFKINKGSTKSHGEKVIETFQNYTDVNVKGYKFKRVKFNKKSSIILKDCDIINYSMINRKRNEEYLNDIDIFMKNYKGYVVVSSGNDESDTSEISQWSYIKKNYPEKEWLERVFIVGEGAVWNSNYNNLKKYMDISSSYGKEIDYIVDKEISQSKNKLLNGSSFTTPVITSILLNQMSNNKFKLNEKFEILNIKNESRGLDFKDNNLYKVIIFNTN